MHISETLIAGLIAWRVSPLIDVDRYQELLKQLESPAELLSKPPKEQEFQILKEKLSLRAYREEVRQLLITWKSQGIGVVVLGDKQYPAELLQISDPPYLITYRGDWDTNRLLVARLSIVGSRRADNEGLEIAEHFGCKIVEAGSCVISGLALGIDGAAHWGSLLAAKKDASFTPTIAVCGSGLSQIYPRTHKQLAHQILDYGGLLISQFDPQEPPYPVNFLNRNRLIAALSMGTLVVQASEKSGSLVTARHALEYGKELFIVPGSIKDPRYQGSNRLLQHGAHLVTSVEDLFNVAPELQKNKLTSFSNQPTIAPEHEWLIALLKTERSIHIDSAIERSPQPENFHQQLLILELDGLINREPGNMLSLGNRFL
jgi:DNA processing protein